jgi:hypothetical protein
MHAGSAAGTGSGWPLAFRRAVTVRSPAAADAQCELPPESLLVDEPVRDFSFIGLFNGAPDVPAEVKRGGPPAPAPAPPGSSRSRELLPRTSRTPTLPGPPRPRTGTGAESLRLRRVGVIARKWTGRARKNARITRLLLLLTALDSTPDVMAGSLVAFTALSGHTNNSADELFVSA